MKTEIKDALELGKLVRLVAENGKDNQYCKEMIEYIDKLHNRIKNLELQVAIIGDITHRLLN